MPYAQSSPSETKQRTLTSSAEVLTLPQGLHLFRVSAASPVRTATGAEQITVPAVHVGCGPGASPDQVSFITGPHTKGTWLCEPGNMIVAKVAGAAATLILTSIRGVGDQQLTIEVERLDHPAKDVRTEHLQSSGKPMLQQRVGGHSPKLMPRGKASPLSPPSARPGSKVEIVTHVQNLGDLSFVDQEWAGGVDQGLWIESFIIKPLDQFAVEDIEYKALTIGGFEAPWTTGGNTCGTQGVASPLIAFAVRMKKKPSTPLLYDCEYSGVFSSGAMVGPVRNGTPCRSATANDPLIGIQVRFMVRSAPEMPESKSLPAQNPVVGPRFSKLREAADREEDPTSETGADVEGTTKTRVNTDPLAPPIPAAWSSDELINYSGTAADDQAAVGVQSTSDVEALSRASLMKRILPFLTA